MHILHFAFPKFSHTSSPFHDSWTVGKITFVRLVSEVSIEAATSSFLPILQGCVPNITSLLVSFSLFTKPFNTSTANSITFFRLRSRASAVTGLAHELPMPLALANNGTCRLHRLPATAVSRRRWRACPRPHRRHRPVGLSCAQLTPGRGTTTTLLSHLVLLVQRHQRPAAAPAS